MVSILYLIRWGSVVRVHSFQPKIKRVVEICSFLLFPPCVVKQHAKFTLHQGVPVAERSERQPHTYFPDGWL